MFAFIFAYLFKLIEGAGPEGVRTDQCHFPPHFLIIIRVFCACGGFATSLKADKHDNIGCSPFGHVRLFIALNQFG